VSVLGGEHFSSSTGKDLDKLKDSYVRFRWMPRKNEKRPKQTVIEKESILGNIELTKFLERHMDKDETLCAVCDKPYAWPMIEIEFYNWTKPETEKKMSVHEDCLKRMAVGSIIEGFRLMGKNPTFLIELNCLSIDKCGFASEASDFRNCEHITLRFEETKRDMPDGEVEIGMSPLLYCKRAHPGEYFIEPEENTYWNIESAGLALMGKRIMEQLKTPEAQAQIQAMKNQNPEFIEGLRKLLSNNPATVIAAGIGSVFFAEAITAKTPEELWKEADQGNDIY
jgi:hypothetical protein